MDHGAPAELLGQRYDDFSLNMVYSKHAGGYYGHVSALSDDDVIHTGDQAPYIWFVKGNQPEPESITTESGLVKYEVARFWIFIFNEDADPEGTLLIRMLEPEMIRYEYFEGKTAAEVSDFTSNSRIYVR